MELVGKRISPASHLERAAVEPTNLCETCKNWPVCFLRGILKRETCSQYAPLSLSELLERDRFRRFFLVGTCPRCGSEDAYDCGNNPLLEDNTVGHCLDCETYWCLVCGYIFETVKKGMECPHWEICAECSEENNYLDGDEFIEEVCPTCEHYADGCQLEDPSKCKREDEFMCPYRFDVSECPTIKAIFEEQS